MSHAEYTERRAAYFAGLREMVARVTARKDAVSAAIPALAVPPYMTLNEAHGERGLPPLPEYLFEDCR